MNPTIRIDKRPPREILTGCCVAAAALIVALVSAKPYASSWNDGSRLAAVESLVDHGTFAIDQSIFHSVPPGRPGPYNPDEPGLANGTYDMVFIDGHYYSSKGPVPCLILAAIYKAIQSPTGLTARERPDQFCYWMTVFSVGAAYVVAVWCVWSLGRRFDFTQKQALALAAIFGIGTMALPYVRQVNNHELLLGVAMPLLLGLNRLIALPNGFGPKRLLGLGTLAGLGYTVDLGGGPALLLAATGLVVFHRPLRGRLQLVSLFLLGASPWLVLHHGCTFAIGGTWRPYNTVAEHFRYPGSPFHEKNLTGIWDHHSIGSFFEHSGSMLFHWEHGFAWHNLPIWAVIPALVVLWRRRRSLPEWPMVLFSLGWCLLTFAVYALGANDFGGKCCSIRWFVPLLAAAFYVLLLGLRQEKRLWRDLAVLGGWGILVGALMWCEGPWMDRPVKSLVWLQGTGVGAWSLIRLAQWHGRRENDSPGAKLFRRAA